MTKDEMVERVAIALYEADGDVMRLTIKNTNSLLVQITEPR